MVIFYSFFVCLPGRVTGLWYPIILITIQWIGMAMILKIFPLKKPGLLGTWPKTRPRKNVYSLRHGSHGPVEIVDLPFKKMVIFHSSVSFPEGIIYITLNYQLITHYFKGPTYHSEKKKHLFLDTWRVSKTNIWSFPKIGVQSSSIYRSDFRWNKPSSELGVPPWLWNPPYESIWYYKHL